MPRGYRAFTLDDYDITEDGKIFNLVWNREVKPQPNSKGYLRVVIGHKRYFVHRLVAERFVSNPENKPQVNHKDGNKLNNCASNLEWVTNQENRNHAVVHKLQIMGENSPWSKLTLTDVKYIRTHREISRKELANLFNVSIGTIKDVQLYRSWKHYD